MSQRSPAPRRSRITIDGLDRTPHRAFLRATGLDDEAIAQPMIGVVTTEGEMTPCNMGLRAQAEAAKRASPPPAARRASSPPSSVSDGVSMNHQGMKLADLARDHRRFASRPWCARHVYDALVGFGGCDKTLPGMMMGIVRLNVPGVFLYGGAHLPGQLARAATVTELTAYEGVGKVLAGAMSEAELRRMERALHADGRLLRRPVHRQHDGHGVGGARPRACSARR